MDLLKVARKVMADFDVKDYDAIVVRSSSALKFIDVTGDVIGVNGLKKWLSWWHAVMNDCQVHSLVVALEGANRVRYDFLVDGTHTGSIQGEKPSGKKATNLRFHMVHDFDAAGLIVGGAIYYDHHAMLTAFGVQGG